MPDDPHVHPEGSFTLFAEKQVDRLVKERTRYHKMQIRILGAAVAVLIAVAAVVGYFVYDNDQTIANVQKGAIASCQSGNMIRQQDIIIWDNFLSVLISSSNSAAVHAAGVKLADQIGQAQPQLRNDVLSFVNTLTENGNNAQAKQKAAQFKAYIARVYAPRNCHQVYKAEAEGVQNG